MNDTEKKKQKFRASPKWKKFRRELKKNQKVDPITGSKLTVRAVCHHRDLNPENYEKVSEERQVMLNPMSHDLIHYVYGDGNKFYDWRERIQRLIEQCEKMDEFNKKYPD